MQSINTLESTNKIKGHLILIQILIMMIILLEPKQHHIKSSQQQNYEHKNKEHSISKRRLLITIETTKEDIVLLLAIKYRIQHLKELYKTIDLDFISSDIEICFRSVCLKRVLTCLIILVSNFCTQTAKNPISYSE